MTNPNDGSNLTPDEEGEIEKVADRFAREWKVESRVGDYVQLVPEKLRPKLTRILTEIDEQNRSTLPTKDPVGPLCKAPPDGLPAIHSTFGDYILEHVLGIGGFGCVYKARHKDGDKLVALKILLPKWVRSKNERDRFLREADRARAIKHPNIVQVLETGEFDGFPYIAFEYIDGHDLSGWSKAHARNPLEVINLFLPILDAISAAHRKELIHRDLKPANILVNVDGKPFVTDFGMAATDQEMMSGQHAGLAGTPAYMAPEQLWDKRKSVGDWTDIFALGVVLYQLLTGRHPWPFDWRKEEELYPQLQAYKELVTARLPKSPTMYNEAVPNDLAEVCLKALELDPRRRFRDCTQFAKKLQRVRDQIIEELARASAERSPPHPPAPPVLDANGGLSYIFRHLLMPQSDLASVNDPKTRISVAAALIGVVVVFGAVAFDAVRQNRTLLNIQSLVSIETDPKLPLVWDVERKPDWGIPTILLLVCAMEGIMTCITRPRTASRIWAWPRIAILVAFCSSISVAGIQIGRSLRPTVKTTTASDVERNGWLICAEFDATDFPGQKIPQKMTVWVSLTKEAREQHFRLDKPALYDVLRAAVDHESMSFRLMSQDPEDISKYRGTAQSLPQDRKYRITVRLKPPDRSESVDFQQTGIEAERLVRIEFSPVPEKQIAFKTD